MTTRPKITLISFGGTIASAKKPGASGATPSLDMGELVRSIPAVSAVADVEHRPAKQIASPHMTMGDLMDARRIAREAIAAGSAGVVVTQGTDTLEEIAYGLDLLHDGSAPVIVTGAMRNASLAGADGPANIVAAIQVAASQVARDLGALVVFNDEIHAPRFVRKSHTASTAAFRSALTGPIGWVAENDVRVALRPASRHTIPVADGTPIPEVALLKVSLGDDGRLLRYLPEAGYAGMVIEGFGGGHLTEAIATRELPPLIAKMPVVLASRAGAGEVLRSTYAFTGSEMDLIQRGVIFAGALDGPKARVLLSLLLASGALRDDIAQAFAKIGSMS